MSSLVYGTARRLSFTGEAASAISLSFSSSALDAGLFTVILALALLVRGALATAHQATTD